MSTYCWRTFNIVSPCPFKMGGGTWPPVPGLTSMIHREINLEEVGRGSSVASPICQEGQSERTFPIFAFFSWFFIFFPDFSPIFGKFFFFAVRGGTLPPLPPQWLCYWVEMMKHLTSEKQNKNNLFLPYLAVNFLSISVNKIPSIWHYLMSELKLILPSMNWVPAKLLSGCALECYFHKT